jgi:hypothetical protein
LCRTGIYFWKLGASKLAIVGIYVLLFSRQKEDIQNALQNFSVVNLEEEYPNLRNDMYEVYRRWAFRMDRDYYQMVAGSLLSGGVRTYGPVR